MTAMTTHAVQLIVIFVALFPGMLAITLTSSADSVCPGDTVVFTCVTDTVFLVWSTSVNEHVKWYYSSDQVNQPAVNVGGIFTVKLVSAAGQFESTATAYNVSPEYNGVNITCSNNFTKIALYSKTESITVEPPPSPPLNLTFTSSFTLCSETTMINWVAPLNTPLCVHSYTVTVRNSCNSSQVMVYNTIDNRSSLSITDLTSDGEYSVTVAGRDGAGRLGQESEELRIILIVPKIVLLGYIVQHNSASFQWKLVQQISCPMAHYLIAHNVSSDQSPITVNRTNVTLYGIQPGETYTVEITPYLLTVKGEPTNFFFSYAVSFPAAATTTTATTTTICTVTTTPTTNTPIQSVIMCSHQSIQSWTVVMIVVPWVLVMVGVATAVILCICKKVEYGKRHATHTAISKAPAGDTSHGMETKIDRDYEEVKHTVETPFTMEHNVAYSTTTTTTHTHN